MPNVESSCKEVAFKVVRKENDEVDKKYKAIVIAFDHDETDEEESNFIRRLRRGSGKYKGKLPFKCFKCGRIGNFASKCPYGKEDSAKQEEGSKMKKMAYPKRNNFGKKKKSLYINEESGFSDASESSEEDHDCALVMRENKNEFLFMAKETKDHKDTPVEDLHEEEFEAVVDLEG